MFQSGNMKILTCTCNYWNLKK